MCVKGNVKAVQQEMRFAHDAHDLAEKLAKPCTNGAVRHEVRSEAEKPYDYPSRPQTDDNRTAEHCAAKEDEMGKNAPELVKALSRA